ncbi:MULTISPECIES: ABC transporter permease [Aeromonas]|uniref:ABC transporter permease n=1 Tax=Aeromonas TaxID=642 RepID=UPI00244415EE|nr:ABC transporter permease [Aeromonas veronii]
MSIFIRPFSSILEHRRLVFDLVRRDVSARYKGTLLGLTWAILNPLCMLALYTFFFTAILKAKWNVGETHANYGLMLFCGLIIHGWMADVLSRSPELLASNRNYVKKVVFPLDALTWISVLSALVQILLSLLLLIVLSLFMGNILSWSMLFLPVVLTPLFFMLLGLGWFISSLSVFFRDIGQFMGSLITLLIFTSTAFFSLETAPELIRPYLLFNPLTIIMDSLRQVTILHQYPDWGLLAWHSVASIVIFYAGYFWFERTRPGFADVI